MRPKTPQELTLNNRFLLGKFSLSGRRHNEIVFDNTPFHTPYMLDDPYDETKTIYLNPRKLSDIPIQYLDNHKRLVGLLWLEHNERMQEEMMANLSCKNRYVDDDANGMTYSLQGPEFYLATDESRKYFVIPLRVDKNLKWNHESTPVYQLKYFSIPTIACEYKLWEYLGNVLPRGLFYYHAFRFMDYKQDSKESRFVYAIQFVYLIK